MQAPKQGHLQLKDNKIETSKSGNVPIFTRRLYLATNLILAYLDYYHIGPRGLLILLDIAGMLVLTFRTTTSPPVSSIAQIQ